jgi:hypothetical protein
MSAIPRALRRFAATIAAALPPPAARARNDAALLGLSPVAAGPEPHTMLAQPMQ